MIKKPFHAEVEFVLGDTVYLKTASDPKPGIVTRITFHLGGTCLMTVSWGDYTDTSHYGVELTSEPSYGDTYEPVDS